MESWWSFDCVREKGVRGEEEREGEGGREGGRKGGRVELVYRNEGVNEWERIRK